MKWVESAGLVKFDFLGLKTLTVIDRALKYLEQRGRGGRHGHPAAGRPGHLRA
jgi:DNA polymerase III alpha subunit